MGRVMIKGGVWRNTEDEILKAAVMKYGKNQWSRIASLLHRKSAKQCKARWFEWLDPSIKKTEWSREEEEKLINLVRLMPTQWRTIASIVGRTASQCLEHYEQLLDQVQNKDNASLDDPRKLKPGEIDPNPETKPARPDPKDMDEDELEMLSEARARLANTQGKKAKRKAREKQLEEARRLAHLQKRRELRMAGININIKNWKHRRFVDYNAEIPFEKPVPKGFHDIDNDIYDPEAMNFKKLQKQHLDGELPSQREERERKKDKKKLQNKKENGDLSDFLNDQPLHERSKLILPAPVISDGEIEQVVKLGKASEIAKSSVSGNVKGASETLLADYSSIDAFSNQIRTPKTSQYSRDNILSETRNVLALNSVDTPLAGGSNVELIDLQELGKTPAGMVSATPNTVLTTPFRKGVSQKQDKDGFLVPFTPKTPALSTPGMALSTPLRDKLAINSEDAFREGLGGETPRELRKQHKEAKESLKKVFTGLPKPKFEYDIVLDEPEKEAEDLEVRIEDDDQAEVDAQKGSEKRRKIIEDEQWTAAVKRGLPRPLDVRNSIYLNTDLRETTISSQRALTEAEELIKDEMRRILYFDALVNPTQEQKLFSLAVSKNSNKSYETLLGNFLEKYPIEELEKEDIAEAKEMIREEMHNLKDGMGHGELTKMEQTKVWDECREQLVYLETQNRFTKANMITKRDRNEAAGNLLQINRNQMQKEGKKANKIEKKLSVFLGGYQNKASEFARIINDVANQLELARIELNSFTALKIMEDRAIIKRVNALDEDVKRQQEREKELQARYKQLMDKYEEIQETIDGQKI